MLGEQEQRARFSYALRKAMMKRGMSARALAKAIGVDARVITKWLNAKGLPNLYESPAIAAALGVNEALFKDPPEVPPPPPEPYYPLDEYLVEAGLSGQREGHRRASTRPPSRDRGTHPRTPERPAPAVGE